MSDERTCILLDTYNYTTYNNRTIASNPERTIVLQAYNVLIWVS